jgi:ElaB/YqjD/DUF883 family membrane-anchored ribosome-binding protein
MAIPYSQTSYEQKSEKSEETDDALIDKAAGAVRRAKDQATDVVDRALVQGREAGAMVQNAPRAARDALNTSLKQQPMATLALAGAAGFLLGALWKS